LTVVDSEEWPEAHGGYMAYLTYDEALLNIPPKRNSLSIVLRTVGRIACLLACFLVTHLSAHTLFATNWGGAGGGHGEDEVCTARELAVSGDSYSSAATSPSIAPVSVFPGDV
jgi:hypothetical protein